MLYLKQKNNILNYLAHILLSGNDRRLEVGNFIGDFVKGTDYEQYPKRIKEGILLHRAIDSFTDNHPVFLETVDMLLPDFGRYSGIMADMFYDYLLASQFEKYSNGRSLKKFTRRFYSSLLLNYPWLPKQVKGFMVHFITSDRLGEYATYSGLYKTLSIMERYKTDAIKPGHSLYFLENNEEKLREQFDRFMPEVIKFSEEKLK